MRINKNKRVTAIIWLEMIGSILPLLIISLYARHSSDDFFYTYFTRRAYIETGSIIEVIKKALYSSSYFLENWNGLYFSSFVQSLSFNVFGTKWYALNTFIIIFMLFASTWFFTWVLICKIAKQNTISWRLVASIIVFYYLQTMPSPVQGLYWFNGSANYLFMWGLFLFWLSCIILNLRNEKAFNINFWIGLVLTFLIMGANHIAQGLIIGFSIVAIIYEIVNKKNRWTVSYLLISAISFSVNALSAGTKTRWDTLGYDHSIAGSFVDSIKACIQYPLQWITVSAILFLVVLMILLKPLMIWFVNTYKVSLQKALFITIFSFGIFFCMNFIPTYVLGYSTSGRVIDFNYLMFLMLIVVNCFYYSCVVVSISRQDDINENVVSLIRFLEKYKNLEYGIMIFAITYIAIIGIGTCIRVPYGSTAANALSDLISGDAQTYAREYDAREAVYIQNMDTDVDIVVDNFTAFPYTIFYKDIETDKEDFKNEWVARFYGLKSVARTE